MAAPAPPSPSLATLAERLRQLGVADEVAPELAAVCDEVAASAAQLEAANEELAAAVAELETTGEDLRRAADELAAMDQELRDRSADVERTTGVLQTVIDGLDGPVVVVDADQRVRVWSRGAAARWGHDGGSVLGRLVGRLDLDGDAATLSALVRSTLADGADEHRDDTVGARCRSLAAGEGAVLYVNT